MRFAPLTTSYELYKRGGKMHTVSFTEARSGFEAVMDQVIEDTDYTIIRRRDRGMPS